MSKFYVTLAALRKHRACYDGYNKVVRSLQGKPFSKEDGIRNSYLRYNSKQQISLISIMESNGLDDALWATRCLIGEDRSLRLYAVWCARRVQHLMTDPRSLKALDVAEAFANGNASLEELHAAWNAARYAAWATARDAAWAAAWAAARDAAMDAARDAAMDAAREAARDAAMDAAWAAARDAAWDAAMDAARDAAMDAAREAARDAARAAAWAAARDAARDAQKEMFIKMCKGQAPWQHITEEI